MEKRAPRPERKATSPKETPQKSVQRQPRKPTWTLDEFQVPEKEGEVRFHDLDLPIKLMQGIANLGFQYATPIQAGSLPETLKGRDAIGKAQTGTGKSAAFLISIITHLAKNPMRGGPEKGFPRALILAPTRELALQIEKDAKDLCKFTPYKILALFGGTGYEKQKKDIDGSVDIIVATPGRLIDFKNQKLVDLSRVEILVIDEADRMLDMGFIPDIRKIVYATPHKDQRQTLFFSATYTPDVIRLADQWTKDPFNVEIEPDKIESASVDQKIYLVTTDEKFPLLYNLITTKKLTKVLVFTNRRDQARRLCEKLNQYKINADLLSGEVAQNKRIRALEDFRSGKVEILVATDVAARGLHIDEISHVINYHLPQDPEHYVHRIGRTGRAGALGTSISFACEDDSYYIPAIEELLDHKLVCEYPENELLQRVPQPGRNQRQEKPQKDQISPSPRHDTPAPEEPVAQEISPEAEDEASVKTTPSRDRRAKAQRTPRNTRKATPKNAGPTPLSPWHEEQPLEEDFESDHVPEPAPTPEERTPAPKMAKKTRFAPMPEFFTQTQETTPAPESVPAPERTPERAPEPAPERAPEPETPVEATPETIDSEVGTDPAASSARRPQPPRPARNTRRPNTPKYRKRPGNRYSKNKHSDK